MSTTLKNRLKDLTRLLEDLLSLHGELLSLVREKVDALRRADREAIATILDREQGLIDRLQEREGFRRQLMDAIGRELGIASPQARRMTASQLALRIDPESGASLMTAARSLHALASQLAQTNRTAARISREMVGHFERVFESMHSSASEPALYAPNGAWVANLRHRLVDAVG